VAEVKRFSLVRPSLNTPFHIDFDWWSQNERNWRVHLMEYLSEEHRATLRESGMDEMFDLVDPHTAEVRQVDAIQHLLITYYSGQENFLTESSSMVESIFRLFLTNGNAPLTPIEIGERLHRPAETILKVLSGTRVYRGLRPYGGSN
jgi:hypothetical protein